MELLKRSDSVVNLVSLPGTAIKPEGDVILCDIAREDASVLIGDLRELGIHKEGSIAIEDIDSQISDAADRAELAAQGAPSDAVVWEEVESRTSESTELSASFLIFIVLACLIASVGILLDAPILIIGAMIVGPEFGPIAGFCVAAAQRRSDLVRRSLLPLAIGFPLGIAAAFFFSLLVRTLDLTPEGFSATTHPLTHFIAHPDAFSFIVASFAGVAGVLSLTNPKSGALIGVLISVTTIPAAANVGLAAAYREGGEMIGALAQLSLNLVAIAAAGTLTLFIQRKLYQRRRRAHLHDDVREAAGLPVGSSRNRKPPAQVEATRTKGAR